MLAVPSASTVELTLAPTTAVFMAFKKCFFRSGAKRPQNELFLAVLRALGARIWHNLFLDVYSFVVLQEGNHHEELFLGQF